MVTTARPPAPLTRHLGPNWYAAVMGTAILATAGNSLPAPFTPPRPLLDAAWALSALALLVLLAARALHWRHHRDQARAHLLDASVAPFYGCFAMGVLAVGGATMAAGKDVVGEPAALAVAWVLWTAGTALSLLAALVVPYLMVVRHRIDGVGSATPVWLLPVVAPMVAAALGPQLIPHLPEGQARTAMLLGCYAMFGLSLLATLLLLPLVFARLLTHGPLPLALTPTLFLVLGPLGQSTTAVNQLADVAPGAIGPAYAHGFQAFAVVYGVPVLGFALLWLALAVSLVVRAARAGMPFAMTWWGFTFPVGTCVTGAAGLARHTGLDALGWLAAALFALLALAWAVTAFRTVRGLLSGVLLAAPRPAA
ncbi:C4-dicarboxylate ABC transporter [Streptomyces spiroverticillatus]|uniref:C4-dicarboxylate ABC transporter n=1 Tax=Streptomyces finlayi TaxID=67296 RepID=A0A918X0K2_9ACTN|nr:TDT family transporter [Streptomyces finlayi]GHA39043.1 C4-dicarboxylate ABC transporter [Streptomyces spiroverticillatus]GHD00992.1 C4-dicarboxylate ABC transporter [Streptomyces finlayi]